MRVTITGAAGFPGRRLIRTSLERGTGADVARDADVDGVIRAVLRDARQGGSP